MAKPKRGRSTAAIDDHVGARIRERRIMLGLTQQQLAELIGVTYQQAHKYERGINRVSAGRLFEIASEAYIGAEVRAQLDTLRRRRELYTRARPPHDPAGRIVIIVDDGIATGSSMLAAIRSIRARGPRKIVVAVGVAAPSTLDAIEAEADEVVCLHAPEEFYAVGQFFADFSQVTDEMVVDALAPPRTADDIIERML